MFHKNYTCRNEYYISLINCVFLSQEDKLAFFVHVLQLSHIKSPKSLNYKGKMITDYLRNLKRYKGIKHFTTENINRDVKRPPIQILLQCVLLWLTLKK